MFLADSSVELSPFKAAQLEGLHGKCLWTLSELLQKVVCQKAKAQIKMQRGRSV